MVGTISCSEFLINLRVSFTVLSCVFLFFSSTRKKRNTFLSRLGGFAGPRASTTILLPHLRPPVRYATLVKILVLYCSTLINVPTRARARTTLDHGSSFCPGCDPPAHSYGPATSRCHLSNICKQKMVSSSVGVR